MDKLHAVLQHWSRFRRTRQGAWVSFAVIGFVLAILPWLVDAGFGRSWVRVLNFALLYVTLALGLNIVVGFAGLLDLGYVAFYAVGAYLYALLASPHFGIHLPFWVILPMGAALAAMFGALLGYPTLRLRGDYLAIVTLGFGEIIRIFLNNLNSPVNITNGPQGINLIDPLQVGEFAIGKNHQLGELVLPGTHSLYYVFLVFTLLVIFVCIRLQDSRVGRAWVAIREDEVAAEAMGINTRNVKLLAFAMGASFAGVSGGLFAGFQGFVSPESFSLIESIMILCMIVLGGMGNIAGVVLGAVLLTVIPEALRYVGDWQRAWFDHVYVDASDLRMLIFGIVLVIAMIFRPAGLLPSKQRERELDASGSEALQERQTLEEARQ